MEHFMSQEVIVHESNIAPAFPQQSGSAALGAGVNRGAVAIEQDRAIAEAQGQLILAKKFPRDETKAFDKAMKSCAHPALASIAFYNVPRAGGSVSGPSIRLAEELARCYGNFEYGHRELSRDHEKSEVEVYAWDKENNNYSKRQLTVMHVRDTKQGPTKLRDQKDVDDRIANIASKQVRGRILALLPKWMVEAAVEECRKTLAGNNQEPVESRVRKMVTAFGKYGVTPEMLERYLQHSLAETTIDELIDLTGVFNAIKDGKKPSEFFGEVEQAIAADKAVDKVHELAGKAAASKATSAKNSNPGEKTSSKHKESAPANQQNEPVAQAEKPKEKEPEPAATTDNSVSDSVEQTPTDQEDDLF
jgi:hypothetical protein